ncbi:MAG TPA: hypothetical protein VNY80_10265 [Steroidobacteraceae bacterium]|nr:hypothetical protein [Steroidobacteraceae bacterium]
MSAQYFRFIARPAADPGRSPLLEQLLARADGFVPVSDWRSDAFRIIAPQGARMPAVAAAALCAERGPVEAAWVCIAAPVHYVAEMSNVRLAPDGLLTLRLAEAEALAVDFDRVWGDSGTRLIAGRCADLYCIFDRALQVTTCDPQDVLNLPIAEYLPAGPDAPALRRLMSEIEMWLFEHAVNGARGGPGLEPITGLWLWGGGAPLASLPKVQGFCAGDDVFFHIFAGGVAPGGAGVIVVPEVPGTEAWRDAESRWLGPAIAELRSGKISRLDLSAGTRCFSVTARASRRFWRARKPWWEFFA